MAFACLGDLALELQECEAGWEHTEQGLYGLVSSGLRGEMGREESQEVGSVKLAPLWTDLRGLRGQTPCSTARGGGE